MVGLVFLLFLLVPLPLSASPSPFCLRSPWYFLLFGPLVCLPLRNIINVEELGTWCAILVLNLPFVRWNKHLILHQCSFVKVFKEWTTVFYWICFSTSASRLKLVEPRSHCQYSKFKLWNPFPLYLAWMPYYCACRTYCSVTVSIWLDFLLRCLEVFFIVQ